MKFLADHQLPAALARFIGTHGHQAEHVRDLGLSEADDTVIWQHAGARDMVIISKDEDSTFLASLPRATGKLV